MSSIKDSKSICNNLAANFINFSQQNYFNLPIYICIYIKLNTLTLNYYSFIYLFFFSLSSSALNPKGLNYYIEKRRPRRPRRPHHHCHHGSTTPHHKLTHTAAKTLLSLRLPLPFPILFHSNTIANIFIPPPPLNKIPIKHNKSHHQNPFPLRLLPQYGFSMWVSIRFHVGSYGRGRGGGVELPLLIQMTNIIKLKH